MPETKTIQHRSKPFVKWAGGKSWLVPMLNHFLPQKFNNYHEPFLGGGAIFLYLRPKNRSFLSDLNAELINAFRRIKYDTKHLINSLNNFTIDEQSYYNLRNTDSTDKVFNAARFIILNKTCFNGIYRVNSQGKFNVPYGHNPNVAFHAINNIYAIRKSLKYTYLKSQDFSKSLNKIEKNDLVFIDPPYTVAHNNNGFLEYNQKIFTWDDQERLAYFVNQINNKKAYFILTNAIHESIVQLYKGLGKRYELERYSTIAGQIKNRKKISEYLFTNCI